MPQPQQNGTIWQGNTQLQTMKAKWTITATKITVTTGFTGPYNLCLNLQPPLDTALTEFPGLTITEATVTELDADAGRVDITLEAHNDPSQFGSSPLGPPVFELHCGQLTKPIESHSLCGILIANRPNNPYLNKKATWEDWASLTSADYSNTGNGSGPWAGVGKWTLAQYKSIKEAGEDSYTLYYPIVKRRTIHLYPPDDVGSAVGTLQSPPDVGFSDLSGWSFLAGPDDCVETKRVFTRDSEWTGAELWNPLVYTTA